MNNVKKLTRAGMLLAFVIVIISIGSFLGGALFNQIVVGPLVNAVLIATVLFCDLKYGVLMALLTPICAVLTRQLAAPMAPFVPFIMAGNVTLVLVFGLVDRYIKKYGVYAGIILGAVLKTLVLSMSAKYLVQLFKLGIPDKVLGKLITMMSAPQLYSALAGGVVALIFFAIYKRSFGKNNAVNSSL